MQRVSERVPARANGAVSRCLGLGELASYGVAGAYTFTRSRRTTDTASCRAGGSRRGLSRGALVHCGLDNDAGGHKLWQQVKKAYPRRGYRA